ncbi:MAG TPA: type II toxin-antitoxin system HicB family antitoxin [Nitrososphaerales archaeon]
MSYKTFTVRLEKDEETGWITAQCLELPGAISQGRTRKSALRNEREAIQAILEARARVLKKQGSRADIVEVKIRETSGSLLA